MITVVQQPGQLMPANEIDEYLLGADYYPRKENLLPDQMSQENIKFWKKRFGNHKSLEELLSESDKFCVICQSNWTDSEDVAVLYKCKHIHCLECLRKWCSSASRSET